MFQMALLLKGTAVPNCFEIQALLYQVMVQTNSDGRTDVLTHARTKTELKLLQLCLAYPQAGSTKMFQMALQGQQLCEIVLKSMHYCTCYGPDGWMFELFIDAQP